MTTTLSERYAANLLGVLSCYDRMIVTDTVPSVCCEAGMTNFLYAHNIRIFDSPRQFPEISFIFSYVLDSIRSTYLKILRSQRRSRTVC